MKKKRKFGRKLLSFVLTLVMLVGMIPGMSLTAYAAAPVSYKSATVDATTHAVTFSDAQCSDYTVVTGITGEVICDSGWYVVKSGTVDIDGSITVNGDVKLILCDGATLNAKAGITAEYGGTNSLTIYGQSENTGKLSSKTTEDYRDAIENVALTVNGGIVEASATGTQAQGFNGNSVTVNGGIVTAEGYQGIAIKNSYSMTVNGGSVTATASDSGDSAIASFGSVVVNGGKVIATSSAFGANGISSFSNISISGGEVNTTSFGQGINASEDVTISGGTVSVTAVKGCGIMGYNVTINGGTVTATSSEAEAISAGSDVTFSGTANVKATTSSSSSGAVSGGYNGGVYLSGTIGKTGANASSATAIATDSSGKVTSEIGKYLEITPPAHTHSFTYSSSGATITATCGNTGCTLTANPTLTIVKPTLNTYNGTGEAAATLTGLSDFNTATGKTIVTTDIKYVGRDGTSYEESGTAPTNGGKYTAKITLSGVKTGAGDNQSVTASVDYEIGWPDIYVAGNGTANNTAWVHGQTWEPGNADDKMSCTDGVYTISYKKVPAGSYEFKFTVNGTWDSSYGKESTTNFGLGVWNTVGAYNGENTNVAFSLTEFTDIDIAFNIVEKKAKVDVKPSHTHSFTYSASGDTITAKCSATDCTLPPSSEGGTDHVATLSLVAPTLTTYGGTGDATATLDGVADFNTATGKTIATTDIKYVGRGSTTYAESSTAPTNAGTYTAKITVEGKTASLNYEIAKADPTANAPTGLTAQYGKTLSDVTLTNPAGNTDGTWAWVSAGTTSVGNAGVNTFKANFTPTDTNYKTVENVDVTITVGEAANPATVTGTASVIKGGNTVDLADNVTMNGATGDVGYEFDGEAKGCTLNGSILTSGNTTGTVTVNVTIVADSNYEALAATPITVTINDKGTQTITADDVTATYGDTDKKVTATTNGNGAIGYAVKEGSADYIDVDASTGALTIKKVGTATVVVTAAETDTYVQATKEVTVTITKAAATPATVTANNRTYDGTEKPLVTVTGEPTGGEMQYALGTKDAATEEYTTYISSKTDVGTYYVWYKVVGDDNHSDSEAACVEANIIEQTEISYNVTFKVVNGSWNDGTTDSKTVTLTGHEGDELKLPEEKIPAVGENPNEGYAEGSWDAVPSAETVITHDITYTYTYAETNPELTPGPEPTPTPEPEPTPEPTPDGGSIEINTSGNAGIEVPSINREEVGNILEGTGADISSTDDVKIIVESNTKSEEDVRQDADRLKEELGGSDVTIGAFIDISVAYTINGGARNYISKTGSSIVLNISVPSSMVASGRRYIVYRIHDNVVSIVGTSTTPVVAISSDLFSTYAIGYTTASVEKDDEPKLKPCVHTYEWSEDVHPTSETDGETYYKCTKCGHVLYKQTISAYSYFNTECCNLIKKAPANAKVLITTDKWISVHRSVLEELDKRKDVTLEVLFLEEGYKGNRMSFVIPAGADVMSIIGDDNFVGFIYLGSNFGIKTSY